MPIKGEIATKVIKNTLGNTGGVIGVTTSNTEVKTESSNIREYRYSGLDVNNYIYFNCQDDTTYKNASSDCEQWRIVGVFKDENREEHLKIVKNEILKNDIFPSKFYVNGTTYNIQYSSDSIYAEAYWNKKAADETHNSDWSTAGLQYWLNSGIDKEIKSASDGYMSYLNKNAKDMIEETKYYLGTVSSHYTMEGDEFIGTPKEVYANERDVASCKNNTGSNATESGCRVWNGNKAIWTGNIAILYPSDYGFTADSSYWDTELSNYYNSSAVFTTWLYKKANHSGNEWFLSPVTLDSKHVVSWISSGYLGSATVNNHWCVRPCLYLKSEVKITDGDGSSTTPYFATIE